MKIVVCLGSACHTKGSRQVIEQLQYLISEHNLKEKVELAGVFCTGNCEHGVCVTLDGEKFSLSPDTVTSFFEQQVLTRA